MTDVADELRSSELNEVQKAVKKMMADNKLDLLPLPAVEPTNDMAAFPDISRVGLEKVLDPAGSMYCINDKDGYVLFGHDIIGDNAEVGLVDYLPSRYTEGFYIVDVEGNVTPAPGDVAPVPD